MIDRILSLFREPVTERPAHDIGLACAALLTEIMKADHQLQTEEEEALRSVLQSLLNVSAEESHELLQRAGDQAANDLFQFTRVINDSFSESDKYRLIHGLWLVAYSDTHLDKYEEHMVRRIAELIYVPHSQFIRARNQARDGHPCQP